MEVRAKAVTLPSLVCYRRAHDVKVGVLQGGFPQAHGGDAFSRRLKEAWHEGRGRVDGGMEHRRGPGKASHIRPRGHPIDQILREIALHPDAVAFEIGLQLSRRALTDYTSSM